MGQQPAPPGPPCASPAPGPFQSDQAREATLTLGSEQTNSRRKAATGLSPIISLFAELLFKVAQGQALSLQHPPVWNLFSTEKVGDDQLAGLERVDPCWLLWLFVTENKMQHKHLKAVRKHANTHSRTHTHVGMLSPNTVCRGRAQKGACVCAPISQRQPPLVSTQSNPGHLCRAQEETIPLVVQTAYCSSCYR